MAPPLSEFVSVVSQLLSSTFLSLCDASDAELMMEAVRVRFCSDFFKFFPPDPESAFFSTPCLH